MFSSQIDYCDRYQQCVRNDVSADDLNLLSNTHQDLQSKHYDLHQEVRGTGLKSIAGSVAFWSR